MGCGSNTTKVGKDPSEMQTLFFHGGTTLLVAYTKYPPTLQRMSSTPAQSITSTWKSRCSQQLLEHYLGSCLGTLQNASERAHGIWISTDATTTILQSSSTYHLFLEQQMR